MSEVRALARDIFIYDLQDFDTLLGALVLTAGMTNANLYAIVNIIIDVSPPPGHFILQDDNGETAAKDTQPLLPGAYFSWPMQTADAPQVRVSRSRTRMQAFKDQVRERDGRCEFELREGFEAAHIFPLAFQQQWNTECWDQRITILPSQSSPGRSINSVQNGLLLRSDVQQLFDTYNFSIKPDDSYKIICFQRNKKNIAGTFLDARLLNDPRRPLAILLQWHFRQAVLTNMKGAGEPCFKHDFPPGEDMMGEIRNGPKAAERMEFELFDRLADYIDSEKQIDSDAEEDGKYGNVSERG
ncbi:hypothetical protein B0H67DRAFT_653743 [Lasiosphaeris hirsuta]|uniref:HNH nuclease domain-containing protein n=1 Tax=Lasiosphaeris hirsuta TaxID=260670 RepID=A0AA40BBE7_9PEZI|nr:hypothetical protein B0H67DRAFT_653743 [Lasiosphaeris hirsuta]